MQSVYEDKVQENISASVCSKFLEKYENAEVLTRQMCLALIYHITIDEFHKGKKERDIHVYYKFIDKGYADKH